jgi:hypothetical protein
MAGLDLGQVSLADADPLIAAVSACLPNLPLHFQRRTRFELLLIGGLATPGFN